MQAWDTDPEFTLVARAGQRRPAHVVVQVELSSTTQDCVGWYSSSGWLSLSSRVRRPLALLSSTSWRKAISPAAHPEGGVHGINVHVHHRRRFEQ